MDNGYSVLMGIFAAAILLYAGLMALTRDYGMLPLRARQSVKPKDPKLYAFQLAKAIALTACAPALSALVGLWNRTAAFAVLFAAGIAAIWLGTRIMRDVE